MNQIEQNIIVGSILGDGSLALYGRSKNAHYREHGGDAQVEYRKWKASKLSNLGFKFSENCKYGKLSSPSHPVYTDLYNRFYKNKVKIITQQNIALLDHPIGLACLYMDDGSLVMNTFRKKNKIYLFPHISIYSLNFTEDENILLKNHIKSKFNIEFKLKKRPDGKKYILEIGKRNEISKFISLVSAFVKEIDCMKYKIDVSNRLENKKTELEDLYPDKEIIISSLDVKDNSYSAADEALIIKLKKSGLADKEIAINLNRTYHGTVDKIRRLRKQGKL